MSLSAEKLKMQMRMSDSLVNLLTGLGTAGYSKSPNAIFTDIQLSWEEMESAYGNDWLSGKVCDVPPFDMTREWRHYSNASDEDFVEDMRQFEKKLQLRDKMREALTWGRLYGGGALIINVDDGRQPDQPLNIEAIKKDGLRWLIVSDARYLRPFTFDQDPFSPNYGYPNLYTMAPSSVRIHHSRVIRFEGKPLPLNARRKNGYWGKSVIESLHNALKNAASVQDNVGELVYEATVDVMKIPDLQDMVSNQQSEQALQKRMGVAKLQKATNRMMLIAGDEEYEQHQQTFTGLKDIMQQFLNIVAGAADIPITRLLGQSPGGLNSTGESDLSNYYDFIAGQQSAKMQRPLELIDIIMYKSLTGTMPEPEELDFDFNELWQMTDEQRSTIELNRAQRDDIYLTQGVINEEVTARQLASDGTYNAIDSEYIEQLEEMTSGEEEDDTSGTGENESEEEEEQGQTSSSESSESE